jgi:acetyl esterase/lipase
MNFTFAAFLALFAIVLRTLYVPRASVVANVAHLIIRFAQALGPPMHRIKESDVKGIETQRLMYRLTTLLEPTYTMNSTLISIKSSAGHDIPVRVYNPPACEISLCPLLVFYHGGGFVIGDTKMYEHITTFVANGAGVIVAAVEYRLGLVP